MDFDNLLCERADALENATQDYLVALSGDKSLDWDIGAIREVLDVALGTLAQKGCAVCNPFHEDDVPCCLCPDRGGCPVPDSKCPMI